MQLKEQKISAYLCSSTFIYPASLRLGANFAAMHVTAMSTSAMCKMALSAIVGSQCTEDVNESRSLDTFKLLSEYTLFKRPLPHEYTIQHLCYVYGFIELKHCYGLHKVSSFVFPFTIRATSAAQAITATFYKFFQ